jgi:hypothetical protein
MIRQRYDSYLELPESLPEEHWDFPYLVRRHIERVYPSSKKTQAEVDVSDIEG